MWVVPSYDRPLLCQMVLDGATNHGFTGPGVVAIDGKHDPRYDDLRLPQPYGIQGVWTRRDWKKHVGQHAMLNDVLQHFPNERSYGICCDDQVPQTDGWQQRLEEVAGDWYIASAEDGLTHGRRHNGQPWMGAAPCFGGKLIRAVGYFAPPGTENRGTDHMWAAIGRELDLLRFCPDVHVTHHHWRNWKRRPDEADRASRRCWKDKAATDRWMTYELPKVCARIRDLMRSEAA